jgi:hypothetical protein
MAKLSVAEAAKIWIAEKRELNKRKARLDAAADVLKEHFRKTGRSNYKGQIGYAALSRVQLDTAKVKAELGPRLPDFQRSVFYEVLSLIEED